MAGSGGGEMSGQSGQLLLWKEPIPFPTEYNTSHLLFGDYPNFLLYCKDATDWGMSKGPHQRAGPPSQGERGTQAMWNFVTEPG